MGHFMLQFKFIKRTIESTTKLLNENDREEYFQDCENASHWTDSHTNVNYANATKNCVFSSAESLIMF